MIKEGLCAMIRAEEEVLTATLHGEIDHHTAAKVRGEIDTALFKHRPKTLRIDLAGVDFMDSSGLGLILGRAALCRELNAGLTLLHPGERIMRVFRVVGLERLTHITIEE